MGNQEQDQEVEALFRSDYLQVVRSVRLIVGSDAVAEDLAQEAFCKAVERWRRVRGLHRPGAWVQVVAVRLGLRHRKRHQRELDTEPGWVPSSPAAPADIDLARAIAELPAGQRDAVVLHHLCDLTVHDTAEALGVRPGTVKTQLHRGRTRLAQLLDDHEEVDDVTR